MLRRVLKKICFKKNQTIYEVSEIFNETAKFTDGKGFGVILDKFKKCIGVITDGDIRRNFKKINFNNEIYKICNKDFFYATINDTQLRILRIFEKLSEASNNHSFIPLLDKKKKVVDIMNYNDFLNLETKKKIINLKKKNKIVRVKIPSRISFAGGGTDFSHYIDIRKSNVLCTSINKFITVSIYPRNDKKIIIRNNQSKIEKIFKNLETLKNNSENNLILNLLKNKVNINDGFELDIKSDFEVGTGLGGSSALTCAIIFGLSLFFNQKKIDNYQLINEAYKIERLDSKIKGGWQDYYASVFGGFNLIELTKFKTLIKEIKVTKDTQLELENNLLLYRIGSRRNSGLIQEKKLKNLKKNKNKIKYFLEINKLSLKMKKTLLSNDTNKFGKYLDHSWDLKVKINPNATTNKINKIYKTAKKRGALGGKLLGAGKSGYLLIYAKPEFHKKINSDLFKQKLIPERINFTNSGIQFWVLDK